jgi:hypothetical protein
MPTNDRRPGRRAPVRRHLGAGLAAAAAAIAMLMPAPAHATDGPDGFARTAPSTHAYVEIDLFRAFTNCLAEAAHGDSMYPGVDPSEVNRCLADYGF